MQLYSVLKSYDTQQLTKTFHARISTGNLIHAGNDKKFPSIIHKNARMSRIKSLSKKA